MVKKKAVLIATPVRKKMIDKGNKKLSIRQQCRLLNIERSSLYYAPCGESTSNLALMQELDKLYLKVPFYGVNKLITELQKQNYHVNKKRLRRLMHLVNWQTLYPKKRTTRIDETRYKYPYLLKNRPIERSNQVWAIDITYVPMKKGFMYLFAIIDLKSRFIVGWSISNSMTSAWCVDCLKEAIKKYGKPEIINSDQGSQFTCNEYVNFLKSENIEISMDGKGRYADNIFIE